MVLSLDQPGKAKLTTIICLYCQIGNNAHKLGPEIQPDNKPGSQLSSVATWRPKIKNHEELNDMAWRWLGIFIIATTLIAGCGGSGSSSKNTDNGNSSGNASTSLRGVAASGAALAGASVSAKDVTGTETGPVHTDDNGSYELDLAGTQGPYAIRVVSMDGAEHYSAALISDLGGTVNITPLTSIIVASATNKSPKAFYDSYGTEDASALTSSLESAISSLVSTLDPVAKALDTELTESGLLRGTFAADHRGIDRVLDALKISFSGSKLTIADKRDNIIASHDMASSPLTIAPERVTAVKDHLKEYADATAAMAKFLVTLSANCGQPVLNDDNDRLYDSTCTQHLAPSGRYLNEGVTDPAVFAPGWWNIAAKGGKVTFLNPVLIGRHETHGYKVRYDYVAQAASRIGRFQSEGYFKKEGENWKFQGDQQYLLLDMNAHRYLNENSTKIDVNVFKLFVSSGADSWADTTYEGKEITYAKVRGPGLPDDGVELSAPVTGPDNLPALMVCMPIQDNPVQVPSELCSNPLSETFFEAPKLIASEEELGNMHRYVIEAYTGAIGAGEKLYELPYWLPLRYEYAHEN